MTDLIPTPADTSALITSLVNWGTHTTEETPVSEQPDPIPADDQPHAYVAVKRTHSEYADRPEWGLDAHVIPSHERDELIYWKTRPGYSLIPIGPDGDTGTRAITEPRTVTTVEELDALPIGATILLEYGVVAQAVDGAEDIAATGWMGIGHDLVWSSTQVVEHAGVGASFTVLYVPEAVSDE